MDTHRIVSFPMKKPRPVYKAYHVNNFRTIPQLAKFREGEKMAIAVVGRVFPFKTNNYVVDHLIDWDNPHQDPIYILNFPQKGMLLPRMYEEMNEALRRTSDRHKLKEIADGIRWRLNPHPAGQLEHNVPQLQGEKLRGIQHKYRETVLFFPSRGQTCHAYCTFCFRWPQFVGIDELKFAMKEADLLVRYVEEHKEVTDVLFTGGDPLIMTTKNIARYVHPILARNVENIRSIRFGTKTLAYWPYRFTTDDDADDLLRLFERIVKSGRHVAVMAHFNHPRELKTEAVRQAIARIRNTGATIRTQSPLLNHINKCPDAWATMWIEQLRLGCIPYYMFVVRDTGAQHFFGVPLVEAWDVYRKAYLRVSGLARTVKGPSMSADPGKIEVLGVKELFDTKIIVLRFLQGRNPAWVGKPFFAKYDDSAIWLDDLEPVFEERFFFEDEYEKSLPGKARHGGRLRVFSEAAAPTSRVMRQVTGEMR